MTKDDCRRGLYNAEDEGCGSGGKLTMELPVKFPSDTDKILEEVARFRLLTAEQRFQSLRGLLDAGALILRNSPKTVWARQHAEEQEVLAQKAIREFIARHGY
jgi:hypothetical protein